MPEDRRYPLDRDALEAWSEAIADSHDKADAWLAEAEKIENPARRQASILAITDHALGKVPDFELAQKFIRRAQNVPFETFRASVSQIATEAVALCRSMTPGTRTVLVLPDKALKSSTWVAQLLWMNRDFADCVTHLVKTPGEAMKMTTDGPTLIVHPDDASYSGGQVADDVRVPEVATLVRSAKALRKETPTARSIVYFFAIPYVSSSARSLIRSTVALADATTARGPDHQARLDGLFVFPSNTHSDDMEILKGEEKGSSSAFGGSLTDGHVPIYFDHKLADNVSVPNSIFAGAPSVRRVSEGFFQLRATLLIGGCSREHFRYHGRPTPPGIVVADFDLGRTCPRAYYKTIGYTSGGVPIDTNLNILDALRSTTNIESALAAERAHLTLARVAVPRAHASAAATYFPTEAPLGTDAVVRSLVTATGDAAEDFAALQRRFSLTLHTLRRASVDPDVIFASQWAFVRAVYRNFNFTAEHVVPPPYILWKLAVSEDGPVPPANAVPSHYEVADSGDIRPVGDHPLVPFQKEDEDFDFRFIWNPAEDQRGGYETEAVVYNYPDEKGRVVAYIDQVAGTLTSFALLSPFWDGMTRAFEVDDASLEEELGEPVAQLMRRSKPEGTKGPGVYTIGERVNAPRLEVINSPWNARVALLAGAYGLAAANIAMSYLHNEPLKVVFAETDTGDDQENVPLVLRVAALAGPEATTNGVLRIPFARSLDERRKMVPVLRTVLGSTTDRYSDDDTADTRPASLRTFYGRVPYFEKEVKKDQFKKVLFVDPHAFVQLRMDNRGWSNRQVKPFPERDLASDLYAFGASILYKQWIKDSVDNVDGLWNIFKAAEVACPIAGPRLKRLVAGAAVAATLSSLLDEDGEWPGYSELPGKKHASASWLLSPGTGYYTTIKETTDYVALKTSFKIFSDENAGMVDFLRGLMYWDRQDRLNWLATPVPLVANTMFADRALVSVPPSSQPLWEAGRSITPETARRAYYLDVSRVSSQ